MTDKALITALIYTDSHAADALLRETALVLLESGRRLAGLIQHNQTRPGRSRCDMMLENLATGDHAPISQDRGPHARGCALDPGQLLDAMQAVRLSLAMRPDFVILNKFGKSESEGGGFRPLIAEIAEAEIPLLIAVPWRNVESWRCFAGELAEELVIEGSVISPAVLARSLMGGHALNQDRAANLHSASSLPLA